MVKTFVFNHYEVNTYLIVDPASRRCALVDPACEASFEDAQLEQYIKDEGLTPSLILLTHAHVDHIAGLRQACEHWKLPVAMHPDGRVLLQQAAYYGPAMGFAVDDMSDLPVEPLQAGQRLMLGQTEIECRHTPGHCPGSMSFVVAADQGVITGDALFHLSIGRTDLPGGDYPTLIKAIREQLLILPDDYRVLPGHGIASTIGLERRHNPYLR